MNLLSTLDTYVTETCCNCGIRFAMTQTYYQERRRDGRWWYCPNGHSQHYTETDSVRLARAEDERARAEARARHAADQLQASERSNRALRGHLTRGKRRAAAGVCPCCTRRFANMAAHMRTQHPHFAESTKDVS